MLARAFADDPAISFIFPDPGVRARKLPAMFALLFDTDAAHGMRLVAPGDQAATLWRAPGHASTGLIEMLRYAMPMLATFGTALGRALAVSEAIDRHQPKGDYWYLHIAGCDPVHQGKGIGGGLVRAGIDRVAAGRLPVYLETPLEKNIGFYRGLGFEVTDEWIVSKGGPRFWSMWRPA